MGRVRGIVFDLDGVLVDTEPLYLQAVNETLALDNVAPMSDEENRVLLGTSIEETWRRVVRMRGLTHPLPYYLDRYNGMVDRVMRRGLRPQPGVVRLLDAAKARSIKSAVATSALRSWVDLKLGIIGLQEAFEAVVCGDEIERTKPAPDIYLRAVERLGLTPDRCIAIEDSPIGIEAAVTAGLYTIAVRTPSTEGMDISRAHRILNSLEDFDLTLLDGAHSAKARTA